MANIGEVGGADESSRTCAVALPRECSIEAAKIG